MRGCPLHRKQDRGDRRFASRTIRGQSLACSNDLVGRPERPRYSSSSRRRRGHAGIFRSRDLGQIPRQYLRLAEEQGKVTRVARGLYVATDANITENHDLAFAAKRIPHGVVCLVSALRFHELTTQTPHEVWLAIDTKARLPKLEYPPLRIVRFSGVALSFGAAPHAVEGVPVRITAPAKTVADCFKYRNKTGLEWPSKRCVTATAQGKPGGDLGSGKGLPYGERHAAVYGVFDLARAPSKRQEPLNLAKHCDILQLCAQPKLSRLRSRRRCSPAPKPWRKRRTAP